MKMQYRTMVQTGTDPKWYGNAARYDTHAEAENAARDLANRWLSVVDWKVEEVHN